MESRIECSYEKMMPVAKVIPNPKNPNKHSQEQIEWLARIIEAHGWRHPITVSKLSGFIVSGHGRLEAAKVLGCKEVPVDLQHFESEAEEHAVMMADNFIAELAETDAAQVKELLVDLDDEYPLDLLGLTEQQLDQYANGVGLSNDPNNHWEGMPEFEQPNNQAFRTVLVHFMNEDDVQAFSELVDQRISDKTKYIYYPEQKRMDTINRTYEAEE